MVDVSSFETSFSVELSRVPLTPCGKSCGDLLIDIGGVGCGEVSAKGEEGMRLNEDLTCSVSLKSSILCKPIRLSFEDVAVSVLCAITALALLKLRPRLPKTNGPDKGFRVIFVFDSPLTIECILLLLG